MQTRAVGGMLSMVIVVHPGSVVLPVGLGWAACGLPVGKRHGAFAAPDHWHAGWQEPETPPLACRT